MVFLFDLAFAVELLALGLGFAFLIYSYRNKGVGVALGKVAGYTITILAALSLLCTTYYGFKYLEAGYFKTPGSHKYMSRQYHRMQKHKPMMERMMQHRMEKMMKQMQKKDQ